MDKAIQGNRVEEGSLVERYHQSVADIRVADTEFEDKHVAVVEYMRREVL